MKINLVLFNIIEKPNASCGMLGGRRRGREVAGRGGGGRKMRGEGNRRMRSRRMRVMRRSEGRPNRSRKVDVREEENGSRRRIEEEEV